MPDYFKSQSRQIRKLIRRGIKTRFGKGTVAFFVVNGVIGISNFVFAALVSRILGPASYGELGALLNLALVISVLLGGFQVAVTTAISGLMDTEGDLDLRWLTIRTAVVGMFLTLILLCCAPFIRDYLHLTSIWGAIILAGWCLPTVLGGLFQGVLMAENRFGLLALAGLAGTVIGRLVIGLLLVKSGFGVPGAIAATVLGQILAVLLVAVGLRGRFGHAGGAKGLLELSQTFLSTAALAGFWLFGSEDTVLARHFLNPASAGAYAAASTAGRIALYATGSIALLALPSLSRKGGHGVEARTALRWAMAITAAIGFVAAAMLAAIPKVVVSLLYGDKFFSAIPALRLLGLEASILGLVSVLTYAQIAKKSWMALMPWVGVFGGVLSISVFHKNALDVAEAMLVNSIFVIVLMLAKVTLDFRKYSLDSASSKWHLFRGAEIVSASEK